MYVNMQEVYQLLVSTTGTFILTRRNQAQGSGTISQHLPNLEQSLKSKTLVSSAPAVSCTVNLPDKQTTTNPRGMYTDRPAIAPFFHIKNKAAADANFPNPVSDLAPSSPSPTPPRDPCGFLWLWVVLVVLVVVVVLL